MVLLLVFKSRCNIQMASAPEPVANNQTQEDKHIMHTNKKVNAYYLNRDIYQSYLHKDFDKCLSLMKIYENMNKNKKSQFHLYLLGLISRQFTQFDKSLHYFKQCYMMDKLNFEYLKEMAKGMYLNGKYKSALDPAKDALQINQDQEIIFLIAQIELSLGNIASAKGYLEKSIEIEPTDEAYIKLSQIYLKIDKQQKALTILKEGLKTAPENTNLIDAVGLLYLRINRSDQAEDSFIKSLSINQKDTVAMLALGYLLQEKDQIESAFSHYRMMHNLSPNSPQLWSNVGLCLMSKGKHLAAYCCFRKSIFLNPFEWQSSANMGILCLKMKKYTLASIYFSTSLTLNPKNTHIMMLLGISLTYLQDYTNAQTAFKEVIKIQKASPNPSSFINTNINYFKMCIRKGDQKKAQEILSDLIPYQKEIGEQKIQELKGILYQGG